jgi:hypothetical protein
MIWVAAVAKADDVMDVVAALKQRIAKNDFLTSQIGSWPARPYRYGGDVNDRI